MVNLNVIEDLDTSLKKEDKEDNEGYKEKVLTAKENVKKMFAIAEEKGISIDEVERDVDDYLTDQGLTSFELRVDGERKDGAYLNAFLHGFNTKFKDIVKAVAPEILPTDLTISPFDPEFLEKSKQKKQAISNMIEKLFTEELPGVGKIIDQGFTPENLGERMADQAGESLVEFLPMLIAPQVVAAGGPVQGLKTTITQDPSKLKKLTEVLGSSVNTIVNQYIKNPGKAFVADVSASIGFGAGEQLGAEVMSPTADETQALGYQDTPGLVETTTGLAGASIGVLLSSPLRTAQAITKMFGSGFGVAPLVSKLTSGIKTNKEKKVQQFFEPIIKRQEDQITSAKDIENLAVDKTGKKLKLTTAEETISPAIGQEQVSIEAKMAGSELDNVITRRVNNINTMDEVLSNTVPKTDKDFTIFIDQRQGTVDNIVSKLDDQITVAEGQAKEITETIKPTTTKAQSGKAIRDEIEKAQFDGAQKAVTELNNIPASNQLADAQILESLQSLTARTFETGTQPKILTEINKKIDQYLPTVKKNKDFDAVTKRIIETEEIIPPVKELRNQDLFDIWLSASIEETSLIGKAGIETANKLQRLSEIKGTIYKALQRNLENVEGAPKFFDELNNYIGKFEEGVVLQLRDKKPAGYPIKDEAVADSFFQANNVEAMKKFINVFGDNPNAVANMKDAILDRLANESIDMKTGLINADNYKRFLTKYDTALKELAKTDSAFVESLKKTPTAFSKISDRLATLDKRKAFVQGEKLKTTLGAFGAQSKQFNFGSTGEYVDAALANPKLMSNITQRVMKAGAGEPWAKAVTEKLTNLRIDPKSGAISAKEISNMEKFIAQNEESLQTLFSEMGKGYEKHLDNLKLVIDGFKRVNFVPAPKGSPAPTPSEQMRQALGTDIPQVWSRAFAVASNRTGWKFVGAEVFNRFLNTVGIGHFNKVMKEAVYNPEFAKTLVNMQKGKESTVGDLRNVYGVFAKLNGTIGSLSEHGTTDASMEDEVSAAKELAPTPEISFSRPSEVSRLSDVNIANPVGVRPTPVVPARATADTGTGNMDMATLEKGRQVFGADDAIFGMAQGGIMNARKPIQRVA